MNARLPVAAFDDAQALSQIAGQWDRDILAQLSQYIAVPAKSPLFDPLWAQHGFIEAVVHQAADWVLAQKIPGLALEVVRLPGRTPVIFFELAGTRPLDCGQTSADSPTVLMYGHLDKQPEFEGWRSDLGPWTPHYQDGRLYGRGGADDGYAIYASVAAIAALKSQNIAHPRIVGLIETSEESGSPDLLPYVEALRSRLGRVELVVCLDSGAGNYDQLWLTTSLRGNVTGTLRVEAWCPRAFASCASCSIDSKTARPAACCQPSFIARCQPSVWCRPVKRREFWAMNCFDAFPGLTTTVAARACSPCLLLLTRWRRCSTGPGVRR
jgi:hypothetical protein